MDSFEVVYVLLWKKWFFLCWEGGLDSAKSSVLHVMVLCYLQGVKFMMETSVPTVLH